MFYGEMLYDFIHLKLLFRKKQIIERLLNTKEILILENNKPKLQRFQASW